MLLVVAGCSPTDRGLRADSQLTMPAQALGPYPVSGVVDGDTVLVDVAGTPTTVRLLGIDTPETVHPDQPAQCYGPEAAARADELLTGGQVWLETDPSQAAADTYARTLAYLWLPGGDLVNLRLIEEGYAREYTYDRPYRYRDTFRAMQAAARAAQLGLWSPATCAGR